MKTYTIKYEQRLPLSLNKAWDFFSSPLNLARITPAKMRFVITSDYTAQTKMYPGMIITYIVSPLFGIKLNWMTEITHIREQEYFVDEQRFGPFALWHHQHHFKEIEGGTLMTDILNYAIPYSFIGQIANKIVVRNNIREIFDYREKKIDELFGKFPDRLNS